MSAAAKMAQSGSSGKLAAVDCTKVDFLAVELHCNWNPLMATLVWLLLIEFFFSLLFSLVCLILLFLIKKSNQL